MNRYFHPMNRLFPPKDEDDVRNMLFEQEDIRKFTFMKLFDCLVSMAQKYPQQYPELQNWMIEVDAINGSRFLVDKHLHKVIKITLPVLHYVAAYPTKETFADGVMVAYVFTTINTNFAQLYKKLYEINPRSTYILEEFPYTSPKYLEEQQKYWEQKLNDLSSTIFGHHIRKKYAFSLCGIVKETWFRIPHFVLSTMGVFGANRLFYDKLDIDSYKTNCKDCNKTIVNVR
jgi:hypothetical protein